MTTRLIMAGGLVAAMVAVGTGLTAAPAMAAANDPAAITSLAAAAADRAAATEGMKAAATPGTKVEFAVPVVEGRVDVRLPKDATAAVTIQVGSATIAMELPSVGAAKAHRTSADTTVRDGRKTDLVLRHAADVAQVMTVLTDDTAPTSYVYRFRGAELVALPQGAVAVFQDNQAAGVSGHAALVRAPWATDATGKSLPTSYAVEGEYLTQRIDTTGAVFPVVADPSVDVESVLPPVAVITLNPADQRIILSSGGAAVGAGLGALMCSSFPVVGQALCAAAGALIVTAVSEAFKEYGVHEGCDWKVRYELLGGGVTDLWREGSC
ncbi:hypothetical protein [Plantactinospora soyae]|uniref:Uncharacterized protein n=1 Tax=Plantactinospora soyae TaxID=1544732 RepID=A0A927MA27_9ACTN|nr:hypothetical protein [Plantactinospora soyae]MBE1490777.1 hypothetical protein [Plantactinospora soyae]